MTTKGESGGSISFHEGGKPGHRTWLIIASGASAEELADKIKQRAAGKQDQNRSPMLPDVSARWHGERVHLTAEGGELRTLIPAIIATLAIASTEAGT